MVFAAIRLSLPPRLRYRKRPQKRCPMRAKAHSREHAKAQHLSLGFAVQRTAGPEVFQAAAGQCTAVSL